MPYRRGGVATGGRTCSRLMSSVTGCRTVSTYAGTAPVFTSVPLATHRRM